MLILGVVLMLSEIKAYADARSKLKKIFMNNGILVNDNHVGTIGELYAKIYLESKGLIVKSALKFNDPYDLEDHLKVRYSVKTITSENTKGKTSPINVDEDWHTLIAIKLDDDLILNEIAIINKVELIQSDLFQINIKNRKRVTSPTKTHPKFQWWSFLNNYIV